MTPACRALKGFVVKDVAWASAGIPKVSSVFLCRSLGEITPGTQAISQTGRKTIHHHRRPTKNQNLNLMFRSLRSLISAQEQFLRTERAHGARWARKWRVALTFQNRRPPPTKQLPASPSARWAPAKGVRHAKRHPGPHDNIELPCVPNCLRLSKTIQLNGTYVCMFRAGVCGQTHRKDPGEWCPGCYGHGILPVMRDLI